MHYQKELKKFVEKYTVLNEEGEYLCKEGIAFETLETDFIAWLSESLTENGIGSDGIQKNSKNLSLYFHPDRKFAYTKEVAWLEAYLSKGCNSGACFKLLDFCKARLLATTNTSAKPFEHVEKMDDLLQVFEKLHENSVTASQRHLFASLIACTKEYAKYQGDIQGIQSQLLKVILYALPILCAGPLMAIFYTELTALYGFCLCTCTVGSGLKKNNRYPVQKFGNSLQKIGVFTGDVASILITRILEISLWASNKGLHAALDSSQLLLNYMNATPKPSKDALRTVFKTGELKLLATAFEDYLDENAQQYLRQYRTGSSKRQEALNYLAQLQLIDKKCISLQEKLILVKEKLKELSTNREVNTPNGKLALTIQKSCDVLELLLISPEDIVDNGEPCGALLSG